MVFSEEVLNFVSFYFLFCPEKSPEVVTTTDTKDNQSSNINYNVPIRHFYLFAWFCALLKRFKENGYIFWGVIGFARMTKGLFLRLTANFLLKSKSRFRCDLVSRKANKKNKSFISGLTHGKFNKCITSPLKMKCWAKTIDYFVWFPYFCLFD